MACEQKNNSSPTVFIPLAISTIVDGFSAGSEQEAKFLFERALKEVSSHNDLTRGDIKSGYALFRMINPQDDIERVWCAQFIVAHLLGMAKLARPLQRDKRIGLKLLKASNDAMERIHKKRNGTLTENPINANFFK